MNFRLPVVLLLLAAVLISCKTDQPRRKPRKDALTAAQQDSLDQLQQTLNNFRTEPIPLNEYQAPLRPSRTRQFDLLHTRLEVSFVWEKAQMPGKAWLKLKPYFYPASELVLDAKGFDLRKVALVSGGGMKELTYSYDSAQIKITLDRTYTRNEEIEIFIDYTAKPNQLPRSGSSAITDEKGLYFINPNGTDPNKPQQIWTQGETESSQCWFPTIDAPNERTTQEISITVDKKFTTLSNGKMLKQTSNPDGTRTDYWKMELPHAPYLFMMAVGEFAVVKESCCNGMEVSYYVEPKYEPYAKLIFGHTPEMIEFFGKKMGVPYPWSKFSQVVVRDFVSGAMENTTAVVHFGGLQHDSREHLEETYEDIISHELFHHWFGDLVTCESWGNLPLNESFATYGEYLWREHKYGRMDADEHLLGDQSAYIFETSYKTEPLIRERYETEMDMFDAHSYQKGGCILHMLRNVIGEEAFFEGLKLYLTRNAYTDVEAAELRMAFEDVSGQDLNWFFKQWFFTKGHPELKIDYEMAGTGTVKVNVEQVQESGMIYRLPVNIEIVSGGTRKTVPVVISSRDTTLNIAFSGTVDNVIFDPEGVLLGIKAEKKSRQMWISQMKSSELFASISSAMEHLRDNAGDDAVAEAFIGKLKHPYWAVRMKAISALSMHYGSRRDEIVDLCRHMAVSDPDAKVRGEAMSLLSNYVIEFGNVSATPEDQQKRNALIGTLKTAIGDSAYSVQGKALRTLYQMEPATGAAEARKLMKENNAALIMQVATILIKEKDPGAMDFLTSRLSQIESVFNRYQLVQMVAENLGKLSPEMNSQCVTFLKKVASEKDVSWIRGIAIRKLRSYRTSDPSLEGFLNDLKNKETDPDVLKIFNGE